MWQAESTLSREIDKSSARSSGHGFSIFFMSSQGCDAKWKSYQEINYAKIDKSYRIFMEGYAYDLVNLMASMFKTQLLFLINF